MIRRYKASEQARRSYAADAERAGRFDNLLRAAEAAEDALRRAQARDAPLGEVRHLSLAFDEALTAAMSAAYATERVKIGVRGYDDWIYRRKAKAKPAVRSWTAEAERLLTLRELHRLTGVPRVPPSLARTDSGGI